MPTVDLNRLYKIRSRERTPVRASTSIPDAAGAYLRSVAPAHQAQLAISRQNAEIDLDRQRRRAQGIQTGLRSFENVYDALSRARERQEETKARKYMTGYDQDFVAEIPNIYKEPRGQTANKDGSVTYTGPLTKALDVHKAIVEKRQAEYDALGPQAKEKVDAFLLKRYGELQESAAKKQADLQQEDTAQTFANAADVARAAVDEYKDPTLTGQGFDYTEWARHNDEATAKGLEFYDFKNGYIDAAGGKPDLDQLSAAQRTARETFERGLRDEMQTERLQHVQQLYVETGDERYLQELKAWGMTAEEYAAQDAVTAILEPNETIAFKDDATRAKIRKMAHDAPLLLHRRMQTDDDMLAESMYETREALASETDDEKHKALLVQLRAAEGSMNLQQSRVAFRDSVGKALEEANDQLASAAFTAKDEQAFDELISRLETRRDEEGGLRTETQRRGLQTTIDNLRMGRDKEAFSREYNLALEEMRGWDEHDMPNEDHEWGADDMEVLLTRVKAKHDICADLEKKARGLRTEDGRSWALGMAWRAWQEFESDANDYSRFQTEGQRLEAERKKAAIGQLMMTTKFGYFPQFDEEGNFSGNKRLSIPQIIDLYAQHAGEMTPEQSDEVRRNVLNLAKQDAVMPTDEEIVHAFQWMGVHTPDAKDMMKYYSNGMDGWKVDAAAFKKKANEDGRIEVSRSRNYKEGKRLGHYEIQLSQDAMSAVLEALRAYKLQETLPGHLSLDEVLKKRLNDIRDTINNNAVIDALREAAREYDEQFLGIMSATP